MQFSLTLETDAPARDPVHAEIAAGALFVVSHSGGKDSQAMLIDVLRRVPASRVLVVHASLGAMEWPGALELARDQAAAAGCAFIVATAGKSLLEMVERRFATRPEVPSWPSASTRQCTSDLKRGPIKREIRRYADAHGFRRIVECLGLRAQESANRSKAQPWKVSAQANNKRAWFEWLPVHGWSTAQVFATIRAAGQEPHPAYAAGNERLSCVFCIMASRNDLQRGAQANPELAARYIELERRTGYTMHQSRRPLSELIAA